MTCRLPRPRKPAHAVTGHSARWSSAPFGPQDLHELQVFLILDTHTSEQGDLELGPGGGQALITTPSSAHSTSHSTSVSGARTAPLAIHPRLASSGDWGLGKQRSQQCGEGGRSGACLRWLGSTCWRFTLRPHGHGRLSSRRICGTQHVRVQHTWNTLRVHKPDAILASLASRSTRPSQVMRATLI